MKTAEWKQTETSGEEHSWFQWIDPKTGMSHRSDFAFVIQSERDVEEYLSNRINQATEEQIAQKQ